MPQQGTQYKETRAVDHHHEYHGMRPWMQRTVVGIATTFCVAGIASLVDLVLTNHAAVVRIEQKIDDMDSDFDRFVDLRYQKDVEDLERDVATLRAALMTPPTPSSE